MKNVIDALNRYYDSFINQPNDWHFFLNLGRYIKLIYETPKSKKIIDELLEQRNKEYKKIENLEKKALQELEISIDKLFKITKDNKIHSPELKDLFKEIKLLKEAKMVSGIASNNIDSRLFKIAKIISQQGYKQTLSEFVDKKPRIVNKYGNFIFSETLIKRREQSKSLDRKEKIEIWGIFSPLNAVYRNIFEKDKIEKELHGQSKNTDLKKINDICDSWLIMNELEELETQTGKNRQSSNNINFLIKSDYQTLARDFHNYLLKELNSQIVKIPTLIQPNVIEPNQTAETAEWNRKIEESSRWMAERDQKDKQHRELMKQNRILATKIDKYSHTLDLIIEQAEYNSDGSSFGIDYYYFNFEDRMTDSRMLEKFLTEMQNNGCFEKYGRTNYAGGVRFGFTKTNIKNLKKFKEKRGVKSINRNDGQIAEVEELLDKLENDIKKEANPKAKYNNGILYIGSKEIDFNKKQNQRDLLATLFKEPTKNWSYDEIQGNWDTLKELNLIKYPKNYWRKFYSAGDDINQVIAIETQVKDFIIKNTKEIRMNPKYIS